MTTCQTPRAVHEEAPARPTRRARAAIAVAVIALTGGLTACSSDDSDRLTIYSGRLPDLIGPLLERYSEESGVGIDVRYGDSADLALLIDQEGDRSPADVFLSQSPGAMGYLDQQHRLLPLDEEVLGLVEPRFRAQDGDWVGVSGRVRVLVYNKDIVDPSELPQSVFDLTDARYRDQVGVAPTNGSFQDFVTSMRELIGDERTSEWLEGIKDNGARSYASNVVIVDAVARGEIPMGLVNNYYNEQAIAEDPGIPSVNHYFAAEDLGTLILVTAVGILDTANDRGDAQLLVEFLLSKESQQFYAEQTFEYPLARGVQAVGDKPPLADVQSPNINLRSLGGGLERTRELIAASGLEQS